MFNANETWSTKWEVAKKSPVVLALLIIRFQVCLDKVYVNIKKLVRVYVSKSYVFTFIDHILCQASVYFWNKNCMIRKSCMLAAVFM